MENFEEDREFYLERLKENYQNPQNYGKLEDYTFFSHFKNPTCGDTFDIYIKIDENQNITDVKFNGDGCAISTASMSLLTQEILNKNLEEIKKLKEKDIYKILSVPISPGRVNCALMSIRTLNKALENKNK
jgi:nitrogen fixation NifU-like protein